jgi:ribosome modulation factor
MSRNKAFETAERRGRVAYQAGKPRTTCPYPDHRGASGHVTFSRGFRKAWLKGWLEAKREAEEKT